MNVAVMHSGASAAEAAPLTYLEKMPWERGFAAYFDKRLRAKVQHAAAKRTHAMRYFRLRSLMLSLSAMLALGLVVFMHATDNPGPVIRAILQILLVCLAVLAFLWARRPLRNYEKKIKALILPEVFAFFGPFKYETNGGIRKDIIRASRLFEDWRTCRFEDHITGNYEGINLEMAEITLQRKSRHQDDRYIALQDLVLVFYLGRRLGGHTIVTTAPSHLHPSAPRELPRVDITHSNFKQHFTAYGDNSHEAHDLLQVGLVENLIYLVQQPEVAELSCSFFENKLVVKISNRQNLFEPRPLKESALDTSDIRKFVAQTHAVLQIISTFAQDRKILTQTSATPYTLPVSQGGKR
jgi:hypothetical protein